MKLLPATKIDHHWAVRVMLDAHISTVFNGNCHKFHYNLFCEQVFYYFYHIYKKNNIFYYYFLFQLRVQTFFLGVQCMLMHPRRTGPGPWWIFLPNCHPKNFHLKKKRVIWFQWLGLLKWSNNLNKYNCLLDILKRKCKYNQTSLITITSQHCLVGL